MIVVLEQIIHDYYTAKYVTKDMNSYIKMFYKSK